MRIRDWSSNVFSSDLFYRADTESRRRAQAPPFGRFAAIVVSSEQPEDAQEPARLIGKAAPKMEGMSVNAPAPTPLAVLRGRHRLRLLIPPRPALDVQAVHRECLGGLTMPGHTLASVPLASYTLLCS